MLKLIIDKYGRVVTPETYIKVKEQYPDLCYIQDDGQFVINVYSTPIYVFSCHIDVDDYGEVIIRIPITKTMFGFTYKEGCVPEYKAGIYLTPLAPQSYEKLCQVADYTLPREKARIDHNTKSVQVIVGKEHYIIPEGIILINHNTNEFTVFSNIMHYNGRNGKAVIQDEVVVPGHFKAYLIKGSEPVRVILNTPFDKTNVEVRDETHLYFKGTENEITDGYLVHDLVTNTVTRESTIKMPCRIINMCKDYKLSIQELNNAKTIQNRR